VPGTFAALSKIREGVGRCNLLASTRTSYQMWLRVFGEDDQQVC
jgi:hypothetical protein